MINTRNIDTDIKPLKKELIKIRKFEFSGFSDNDLLEKSKDLSNRCKSDGLNDKQMYEAYALVDEAVKRTLKIKPFDVQIMAAVAMNSGRIAELATGEGKTLVAVFVAFYRALTGKGVHVLTFNDYLAKRDALWMKPVYEFLGMTVGYVEDGSNKDERKKAYYSDITYLTAKEAGFDYLRGFLCFDKDELVERPFNFAIIDEADSILIDEARIPLVIAGDIPSNIELDKKVFAVVSELNKDIHFETDEYEDNVFLNEAGIEYLENKLNLGNLYDEKNKDLLSQINVMLQAQFLLKKDVDYIIKNGEVALVDEFTGRTVKNRQWPDGLHAAVEIKEGIEPQKRGMVMNNITLQNFLRLYPELCGMTGTACSAAPEFYEFYNLSVTVIPPNKQCRRTDKPDFIFTHKEAKYKAIVDEIERQHKTGRPILVGTVSVKESEYLAELLRERNINPEILNAKNNELEAEIIANAGSLNTVTISTNMAGRGVDIKLGGKNHEDFEKVEALGGLYVIGTNRHDSVRIDNQLRGRAGRQGEAGESRFFISFEDDLLSRYGLAEVIPEKYLDYRDDNPINSSQINKAVEHIQRVVEGRTFDSKITLAKYNYIVEDQRKIVHKKREDILINDNSLNILERNAPEKLDEILKSVTEAEFLKAQKAIELYAVNKCYADYLLFIDGVLDGVFNIGTVNGNPLDRYNSELIDCFNNLEERIVDEVLNIFEGVIIRDGKIDLDEMGIKGPSSTRTYMVHDGTEKLGLLCGVAGLTAIATAAPLFAVNMFVGKAKKRNKKFKK